MCLLRAFFAVLKKLDAGDITPELHGGLQIPRDSTTCNRHFAI